MFRSTVFFMSLGLFCVTALGDMSCMSCNFTIVDLGEEILTGDPACEQGGDGVQTFQEGCVACATVSVSLNICKQTFL